MINSNVKEIFFSEKIVLIEGSSEEVIANILIQEGKLDVSTVSIINARSKYNIPRFLKVFNSIGIPYTVLLDEDPYFLPNYTKKNPSKITGKGNAYKKTREIANMVEESLGKIVVISPNLDKFLGVSTNQINNLGKLTAVYEKYKELEEKDDEIYDPHTHQITLYEKSSHTLFHELVFFHFLLIVFSLIFDDLTCLKQ